MATAGEAILPLTKEFLMSTQKTGTPQPMMVTPNSTEQMRVQWCTFTAHAQAAHAQEEEQAHVQGEEQAQVQA